MYDVRLRDPKPGRTCGINWPSNLQGLYTFFRNPNVISAIHASESANTWFECSDSVFNAFNNDLSSPSISFFPSLLSNVPITLYAGEHDLVCNYKGMEALIQSLNWGTQQGFSYGYPNSFFLRDSMIGTYQQERNLTYLLFMNASHMVPIDQPEGMLQLLKLTLGLESARVYLVRSEPKLDYFRSLKFI
ncbi:Cell death protease [Coelomomyces lativittatus]|nr:Cell death protease [Coelomomyces lativittatus]